MSSKEGCVIDRKVERGGDVKSHKPQNGLVSGKAHCAFRPLACQQGPFGPTRSDSLPGCHAQEMRLEPATATGIACARWGLEVVPGVRMFLPGGDFQAILVFLPLGPRNCAVFDAWFTVRPHAITSLSFSHAIPEFVHVHLTPPRVRST